MTGRHLLMLYADGAALSGRIGRHCFEPFFFVDDLHAKVRQ